jgi:hypothetical protein
MIESNRLWLKQLVDFRLLSRLFTAHSDGSPWGSQEIKERMYTGITIPIDNSLDRRRSSRSPGATTLKEGF